MAIDVTAFTALARMEFANGTAAALGRPMPAAYDKFTMEIPSTTAVEVHTYLSALPRLHKFKGWAPASRITNKEYQIPNFEWRIGPVSVRSVDLDDDRTGMYLKGINGLPAQGQKDAGYELLSFLAAGTTNLCFDDSAFFANSHNFGSGDNLDTKDCASNDGVTHKIIALRVDTSTLKPVIFQNRSPLTDLMTDADTAQAKLVKEYQYWADARFGFGYGHWWDGYHMTITDTPTIAECYEIVRQIINGMRSFTLPKGNDVDDTQYVHEGWEPGADNFILLCNLKLKEILDTAISISQYTTSTGNIDNVYKNRATVIATSALGA